VDEEIWDEFAEDRGRLAIEAAAIRRWVDGGFVGPPPSASMQDDVEITREAIEQHAGKNRSGQGYGLSAPARKALEKHSMDRAAHHFSDLGWSNILDVSRTRCFDLLCHHRELELHVEVKGTTSNGDRILLTRNEVTHARRVFPRVALYVLAGIRLTSDDGVTFVANGGTAIVKDPWDIRNGALSPLAYAYVL
jgi:hypothetical protein